MSLFWIIIIGLIVFLLTAGVTEFFRNGYEKPTPKKSIKVKLDKPFDIEAAQSRLKELRELYWRCEQFADPLGKWDPWLARAIGSLQMEVNAANKKMTAPAGRHSVIRFENIVVPSIPQWFGDDKEVRIH